MPLYSNETNIITLKEFIEKSSKNNPQFQEILYDELSLAYNKELKLPVRDLIVKINTDYYLSLNEEDDSYPDVSIGLEKLFPNIGTLVSGQYSYSMSRTGNKSSSILLSFSQSLLKNSFGYANRLKEKVAGIEMDIAKYQILEAYENYYAVMIELYYDWYSSHINLKAKQIDYNDNMKLLRNIQKKQGQGIADKTDINKIQLQVYDKIDSLISASNDYINYCNKIEQALMIDKVRNASPAKPDIYRNRTVLFEDEYKDFTNKSRTYRIINLLEEKNIFNLAISKNNIWPSLYLNAGYRMDKSDPNIGLFFQESAQGSSTGTSQSDSQSYLFAGLSLRLPITGQKEQAEYKLARINNEKILLSRKNNTLDNYTILENLYNEIKKEMILIQNADKKIKLAKDIVNSETKNYQYGRINLNQLISAVNEYERKKLNKIIHEIILYKLHIHWLKMTDSLITKIKTGK